MFSPDHIDGLEKRLLDHVEMLAETIGPRHVGVPQKLKSAAGYVAFEFSRIEQDPSLIEFQVYDAGDAQVENVILERRGNKRPESIIVLGAHYDSVPGTPGADDNASAVAVLIEVARLLHGRTGAKTVRFVAFPCEEPPHFYTTTMGSQRYARRCRERNETIDGMLCLEMVGYYTSEPGSQQIPEGIPRVVHRFLPDRGNFIAAVGNLNSKLLAWNFKRGFQKGTKFPLLALCLPESIYHIRLSDNSSFWDQGYPALMITDTSFMRNPHYHQSTDLPHTLDYASMAQVTIGVAAAVMRLADIR